MDVNLASHTHQIPHVGFPHNEPVTIEIIEKVHPIGAILFANRGINLILKISEKKIPLLLIIKLRYLI